MLKKLADLLRRLADALDPPRADINGNPLPNAGGGPGEEGKQ